MDIPFEKMVSRHCAAEARRKYNSSRSLEAGHLAALEKVCAEFTPFPHARAVLVNEPGTEVFKGIAGSYGKVTGAPAFIAFIGDMRSPSVQEEVGYTGQGIILEAAALGLNTCWVGGFFKPKETGNLIKLKEHERVLAVPLRQATLTQPNRRWRSADGFGLTHRRYLWKSWSRTAGRKNFPSG